MKQIIIMILLTATYTTHAATLRDDPTAEMKNEYLNEQIIVYRGQHEIVKIYFPLFLIENHELSLKTLFLVEADINTDGSKTDRGLYVKIDDNNVKKLLDNGRDVAGDGLGNVYFAASDGIYIYNVKEKTADKYGTLSDSIISLAAENNTGVIHALSENHVLYTITRSGTKVDINNNVKGAEEIAIDIREDDLYYYDADKNAYVIPRNGNIKAIEGLPKNPTYFKMVKAPLLTSDSGMFFIANSDAFAASSNGTTVISKDINFIKVSKPTAYCIEAGLVLYYAVENKIYEYNVAEKLISHIFQRISERIREGVEQFFEN